MLSGYIFVSWNECHSGTSGKSLPKNTSSLPYLAEHTRRFTSSRTDMTQIMVLYLYSARRTKKRLTKEKSLNVTSLLSDSAHTSPILWLHRPYSLPETLIADKYVSVYCSTCLSISYEVDRRATTFSRTKYLSSSFNKQHFYLYTPDWTCRISFTLRDLSKCTATFEFPVKFLIVFLLLSKTE